MITSDINIRIKYQNHRQEAKFQKTGLEQRHKHQHHGMVPGSDIKVQNLDQEQFSETKIRIHLTERRTGYQGDKIRIKTIVRNHS